MTHSSCLNLPFVDPQLEQAQALCDRYNRTDPNMVEYAGQNQPREWQHAQFLHNWILKLDPGASRALRLASHCQHIGRWEIPRNAYPEGRQGYLLWRHELKLHHASIATRLLTSVGYGQEVLQSVCKIILKKGLKNDPEVQCMENALCLVFLEHQYEDFHHRYPSKVQTVLRKTWLKMDDAGRQAAAGLSLSAQGQRHLFEALSHGAV